MFTYPIECFVCREVIYEIFFPGKTFSWIRHGIVNFLLIAATCALSMTTDNLGFVLELNVRKRKEEEKRRKEQSRKE